MTRNEEQEQIKATMRAEFASARAEFIATATPFELKLDGWLARAEVITAIIMVPFIGRIGGQ